MAVRGRLSHALMLLGSVGYTAMQMGKMQAARTKRGRTNLTSRGGGREQQQSPKQHKGVERTVCVRSRMTLFAGAVAFVAAAVGAIAPARAAELLGADFDGVLYDIDPLSGGATNPRPTGLSTLSGIALSPAGVLYGHDAATDSLHQIDPATGDSSLVGFIGIDVIEGDLAFDPVSGKLFGAQSFGDDRLYTIDLATGFGTTIGIITPDGDISALAFDASGALFALDTLNEAIYRVDPATADILETFPLGASLGSSAGMAFDPDTGNLYVADGGALGTNKTYLYLLDFEMLFELGDTNAPSGLSGLTFIPEPMSAGLLIAAGVLCLRRRR